MAEIRLNKIIRTYNIGLQSLVDFLTSKGVEVEANPNAKISDEHLPAIEKQFGKDLEMKQASEKVDIKLTEILEKTSRKQQEKTQEDDFEEPVKETVIKSNVFTPSTPKPAPVPEPEPEPIVPEPEPEVQEEPVVETPVVDSPEVPEPEPEVPSVSKEEEAAPSDTEVPEEKEPATADAPAQQEESAAEPQDKAKEPAKQEGDAAGFKVLGKIDMSQFEKKSSKKRERIAKGSQKVDVAKEGKQADNNSRKDKREAGKKDQRQAQEQGKGRKRGRGSERFKPVMSEEEQEAMQKEIQKQVKETYARMNDNRKNNFGAKYRKEKREQAAAKTMEEMQQEMAEKSVLKVTEFVTVNDLATLMNNTPVNKVIGACMSLGLMVSINQRLDADALSLVAEDFGYKIEFVSAEIQEAIKEETEEDTPEAMEPRAPIVTPLESRD